MICKHISVALGCNLNMHCIYVHLADSHGNTDISRGQVAEDFDVHLIG